MVEREREKLRDILQATAIESNHVDMGVSISVERGKEACGRRFDGWVDAASLLACARHCRP